MNQVVLKGLIGNDPELKNTPSGKSVLSFPISVSEYKGKDESGKSQYKSFWIQIDVWDKNGERLSKMLGKGDIVVITGRLNVNSWTDKDGVKRTKASVVAQDVERVVRGEKSASSEQSDEALFSDDSEGPL
jgi:single-strand DNA-binding protein